jgi:hypothetical protein
VRRILKYSLMNGVGCKDIGWIHLVEDIDDWGELMNTVINFGVP